MEESRIVGVERNGAGEARMAGMEVPEEQQRIQVASEHRACCIAMSHRQADPPGAGTGTFLRHLGDLFVLTCDHVVEGFLTCPIADISVPEPRNGPGCEKIARSDVEIVHRDADLDIAVLRIRRPRASQLAWILPMHMSDLGTEADYRRAVPGDNRYCGTGFPVATRKVDHDKKRIDLNALTLATAVVENHPTELVLDYRHGRDAHGDKINPVGASGMLFFEMIEDRPGELTKPGPAVAMQHKWDRETMRLTASPIHGLREVIQQAAKP